MSSKRSFDPRKADAEAIHAAAKEERQARAEQEAGKPRRGVTSTRAERQVGERLEAALHKAGVADARVAVLARPRGGSVLRIERVPVTALAALAKALRAVHPAG